MRTNAVFSGFSATLEPATIFMNPITFVMNYLYFLFRHLRRHSLNRTPSYTFSFSHGSNHGWTLGGPRYIHLTKGTNAVFSGFFSLLATVAISMNPITFVMNFYCNLLWHPGQSLLESNSDLSLLKFQRCQPWLNLRRRLLYPFNYENECRIFGLFSLFGIGNHIYESNHSRDELPLFLILTSQAPLLESNSKFIPFSFQRVQPWLNLRRAPLYPFN